MRRAEDERYREFVTPRLEYLRRTAFLLCRDWHLADDLVSITLGNLYRHWRRACAADNLDAYLRGILTHAWLDERRRPWHREVTVEVFPDGPAPVPADPDSAAIIRLLDSIPPRQRAVVVLRFYCDLSVAQTAEALGISEGAVKSQAARGLQALRAVVAPSVLEDVS